MMKLQGLELTTTVSGNETICALYLHQKLLAKGSLTNKITGIWTLFNDDGTQRSAIDLTTAGVSAEPEANELKEKLAQAMHITWLEAGGVDQPWLAGRGVSDIAWDNFEDDSRFGEVPYFPYHFCGAMAEEPMIYEYCLLRLHLGITDEGSIYPVTPTALPFLALMIEQPDAQTLWIAQIFYDVASVIANLAADAGIDLTKDKPGLIHDSYKALKNALPSLEKAKSFMQGDDAKKIQSIIHVINHL